MDRRNWLKSVCGLVASACAAPFVGIAKAVDVFEDTVHLHWFRYAILDGANTGVMEVKYSLNGAEPKVIRKMVPRHRSMIRLAPSIEIGVHPSEGGIRMFDDFGARWNLGGIF